MRAGDVLKAAYDTFRAYGDECYAKTKSSSFVYRCGARGDDPEQVIEMATVKNIVYAMLDSDSEELFWNNLGVKDAS